MRKNKFFNPTEKKSQSPNQLHIENESEKNHPLVQNKIYFPASHADKYMPYKIQIAFQNKRKYQPKQNINNLYAGSQRVKSKQRNMNGSNFGRINRFQFMDQKNHIKISPYTKDLAKYKTIQLKNLPGINYTASGRTIYRSKNIKSFGKLLGSNDNLIKRDKTTQIRRNFSLRNEESIEANNIKKSKSSTKQNYIKLKQKNIKLFQTYFSSHTNLKNDILKKIEEKQESNEKNQAEAAENILCKKIIYQELYACFHRFQQQQQYLF